jgi:hypothetical protein
VAVGADRERGGMEPFIVRTADDALALVPVLIGFEPEESVVMLTFGARRQFHARIDLPPPAEVGRCVDQLLAPARHHGVRQVLFVLFSADDRIVRRVATLLDRRFDAAGIRVMDVIQVHDGRRFAPLGRDGVPAGGVPFDVACHPYRLEAVVEGKVVAGSREELARRLEGQPAAISAVEEALGVLWDELPIEAQLTLETTSSQQVARALLAQVRPSGPELRETLDRHLRAGTVPDDREAARILLAVHNAEIRDHAWTPMRREGAAEHIGLWTDLVRRAPAGLLAGAAGVLAFAAWLHGDGALAWCAVDRCFEDDPEHSLGRVVAQALEGAVSPDEWAARFSREIAG